LAKNPKRGEIWYVNLNPARGSEIYKERPVVVMSSNDIGLLPIRLVVPLTTWKEEYAEPFWYIKVIPNKNNGLSKMSAADTLQISGLDIGERFIQKVGFVSTDILADIAAAVAMVVEYV